jgi:hypothetical protein
MIFSTEREPSCPPTAEMIEGYKKMMAAAKEKGITVPAVLEPRDNIPCPPTPEMKDAYMALMPQLQEKGIAIPEGLDPSKMPTKA